MSPTLALATGSGLGLFLALGIALIVLLLGRATSMGTTDPGTIGSFNDFMYATRQRPLSGPEKIANMASRQRTYLSRVMVNGLQDEVLFQDGTEIVEFVQLAYTANARNYLPTADQTPTAENSLTQIKIPWRFTLVDSVWYDHEIILNNGDEATVFKRLMKVKRQKMFLDLWDKMEDDYWAAPLSASMEGGNTQGVDPYSLLCFITTDGLVPSTTNSHTSTSWSGSTLETVTVATYSNFQNQYDTYDSADLDANLEDALNRMWVKVQFESPDDSGGKTGVIDANISKYVILTNLEGYTALLRLVKNNNAESSPKTALGWANGKITLNGIPIRYISKLDSTAICPTGKPKFFFFNFTHIRPVFHRTRYLYAKSFEGTIKQPMANAEYRDTWRNLVCVNRREQGVVCAA